MVSASGSYGVGGDLYLYNTSLPVPAESMQDLLTPLYSQPSCWLSPTVKPIYSVI